MSIRSSLIGILAALISVSMIQGWFAIGSLSAINDNVVMEATTRIPTADLVNKINSTASDIRITESYQVMTTSEEVLNQTETDIGKILNKLSDFAKSINR